MTEHNFQAVAGGGAAGEQLRTCRVAVELEVHAPTRVGINTRHLHFARLLHLHYEGITELATCARTAPVSEMDVGIQFTTTHDLRDGHGLLVCA